MRELCGLIGNHLRSTNRTAEDIFREIDEDDNGDLDPDEFIYYFANLKN